MDRWEYRRAHIKLKELKAQGRKYWNYVTESTDGTQLEGLETILNHYGSHGWELVNLIPTYWAGSQVSFNVETIEAIFKRQKEAS